VDCTLAKEICSAQEVKGYPTFLYFADGKFVEKYTGGRSKSEFLSFIKSKPTAAKDAKEEL